MRSPYPLRARPLAADRAGTTALEFGLVAPMLVGVLVVALELATQLLMQLSLDQGVAQAQRDLVTGTVSNTSTNAYATFVADLCDKAVLIPSCPAGLAINVVSGTSFATLPVASVLADGTLSASGFHPPGSAQVAAIQVTYRLSYAMPIGFAGFGTLISQAGLQADPYLQ